MTRFAPQRASLISILILAIVGLASPALAQDPKGDWHGALVVPPGTEFRVAVHIKAGAAGALEGALDSPDQGRFGIPLTDVAIKDGRLTFTVTTSHATFSGAWDAASRSWTGPWTLQGRPDFPVTLTPGDLPHEPAAVGLDGEWDGQLDLGTGLHLRLAFHIVTDAHGTAGTYDSVDQGVYGVPVRLGRPRRGGGAHCHAGRAAPSPPCSSLADGQTLAGIFTQGGMAIPLVLKRLPPGQPSPWPKPAAAAGPVPAPPADWKAPSDAEIRALLVRRIDTERQGVGIVVGVVDASGRRVVAYGKSDAPDGRPLDGDSEF